MPSPTKVPIDLDCAAANAYYQQRISPPTGGSLDVTICGDLCGIIMREEAAGGTTTGQVWVADDDGSTVYAAAPNEEDILYDSGAGTALDAAAGVNSLFGANKVPYSKGLTLVVQITAQAGTTSFVGYLQLDAGV